MNPEKTKCQVGESQDPQKPQNPQEPQKATKYPEGSAFGVQTIIKQGQSHGLVLTLQLVASIFVARNLGPESLGELALIQALIMLMKPVLDMGSKGYLIRELVKDPNPISQLEWAKSANIVSTRACLTMLLLVATLILGAELASMVYSKNIPLKLSNSSPNAFENIFANKQTLLLWSYCLGLVIISNAFEDKGYTQLILLKDIKTYLHRNLIISTTFSILRVVLALRISSPYLLIALFFTTVGLESVAKGLWNKTTIRKYRGIGPKLKGCPEKEKTLLKESIYHLPTDLALSAEGQVPKLLLSSLEGSILGNFSVAQKNGIIPKTLNKISHDNDLQKPSIRVGIKYAILGAVLAALTAPLIPLIYGKEFNNATLYAYLLILPGFLTTIGSKITSKMIKESLTKEASKISILGVTLSIILCIILIPNYNIWGVTLALGLGWSTQIFLGLWLLKYNNKKLEDGKSQKPKGIKTKEEGLKS